MRYFFLSLMIIFFTPNHSKAVEIKSIKISCFRPGSGKLLFDDREFMAIMKAIGRNNQDPGCKDVIKVKKIPVNEYGNDLLCKCIL